MRYQKLVVCATATALLVPAGTAGADVASAPRKSERMKYQRLYKAVRREHGRRAPGRNIWKHGVRFKWISKDGDRRHWAIRRPTAREIGKSIIQLRALLGRFVQAVPPPQAPAGVMTARYSSPIPNYIVQCESNGDWNAVNRGSGAFGRYQIMPFHWASGICRGLGRSPAGQTECADRIWRTSGSSAWACA
jgi:Transglycosylase-like domain